MYVDFFLRFPWFAHKLVFSKTYVSWAAIMRFFHVIIRYVWDEEWHNSRHFHLSKKKKKFA